MNLLPPSSDDAFAAIVGLLGLGSFGTAIIFIILLASAIQSWRDTVRGAVALLRAVRRGGGVVGATLRRTTPIKGITAGFITVLVPLGQLFAVGMCFLVGNYISILFDEKRSALAVQVLSDDPKHLYQPDELSKFIEMDWISGSYVLLALVILFRSYRAASRGELESLRSEGMILAWPATIVIFLALRVTLPLLAIAATLTFTLKLMISDEGVGKAFQQGVVLLVPPILVVVVCLPHYLACQGAVHASLLVVRAWPGDRVARGRPS